MNINAVSKGEKYYNLMIKSDNMKVIQLLISKNNSL